MRTNIVQCIDNETKQKIYKKFLKKNFNTRKQLAEKFNISVRTLGRVLDEMSHDDVENINWDWIVTKTQVTLIRNGEPRAIDKSFPNFKALKEQILSGDESIYDQTYLHMSIVNQIEDYSYGNIIVSAKNKRVMYGNFEIKNTVCDKLLDMLERGDDLTGMVKFLDKLLMNPKKDIVDELYGFLVDNNIKINNEGNIEAFKGVRTTYYDVKTNTMLNTVGSTLSMPRHLVVHDPSQGCGAGLHCGSLDYATAWGEIVVKVEVDPSDVVSVPYDCDAQKMRCCKYKVIGDVK